MLSEQEIMRLVRKYASTPKGKAEIKRKYGIEYRENPDRSEVLKYGSRMRQILFEYINREIRSITLEDILVEEPVFDEWGGASLKISFRDGSLKRDSLYIDGYPNGLENIVLLFSKGYHARNYVYGFWDLPNQTWWGGNDFVNVRSRKERPPNDFLSKAVSEFNREAKGFAVAKLEKKYE